MAAVCLTRTRRLRASRCAAHDDDSGVSGPLTALCKRCSHVTSHYYNNTDPESPRAHRRLHRSPCRWHPRIRLPPQPRTKSRSVRGGDLLHHIPQPVLADTRKTRPSFARKEKADRIPPHSRTHTAASGLLCLPTQGNAPLIRLRGKAETYHRQQCWPLSLWRPPTALPCPADSATAESPGMHRLLQLGGTARRHCTEGRLLCFHSLL